MRSGGELGSPFYEVENSSGEPGASLLKEAKFSNCGNILKQFQPSESGNTSRGAGNDSRYGKIEIDARKEMDYPQPSTASIRMNTYGVQFND